MTITWDINYKETGGVFDFDPLDGEILLVDFEAQPRWENDGIGGYEYAGQKCYDAGTNYVSLAHYGSATWKKDKHTPEENRIIQAFMDNEKEYERLEDYFTSKYKEQTTEI